MPSIADNDVVEDFYANEGSNFCKALRYLNVFFAGFRITWRVIVDKDYRGRRLLNCRIEYLPGVNDAWGKAPRRDRQFLNNTVFIVK